MLPALVFLALAAFAAALLGSSQIGRATVVHLMLAVGAMPLIFGAMSHFIPVLTRTRTATAGLLGIPVLALAGGALAMSSFMSPHIMMWGQLAGALLAAIAASALLVWSRRRRAGMLGRPHPCLAWYETALACLVLALVAILASVFWPQQAMALRRLHLHLNTLGFVGLTALGTLGVLLPTVTNRPDPEAAQRMRRDLPWVITGTLLIAVGAAWIGPLAGVGGVIWAVPLLRMGAGWLKRYRTEIFAWHGAAPLLAAALVGLGFSAAVGAMRLLPATAALQSATPVGAFVAGFMLPLVSGAASQLLPVWLRPGIQGTWHARPRDRLGRHAGVRAVLFLIGGVAAGTGQDWGLLLGGATLVWFILQTVMALLQVRNIHKETIS